jgi:hypothetical protein
MDIEPLPALAAETAATRRAAVGAGRQRDRCGQRHGQELLGVIVHNVIPS